MRESELFLKILKDAPKDEVAKNAELLIRGSFVSKLMAGVTVAIIAIIVMVKSEDKLGIKIPVPGTK
jgi:prolyl-tRNA synthetase